jgi:hypothetical protein
MSGSDEQLDEGVVLVIEPEGIEDDGSTAAELVEAVLEAQREREARERAEAERLAGAKIDGVVIGRIQELTPRGPLVRYRGCPSPGGLVARAAAAVTDTDVGRRAALMFEGGDPGQPILTGLLHFDDDEREAHPALDGLRVEEDDQRIDIKLSKAISLSCGKATILITPAGKILLRGKYVLSRASGVNRLQGGSVRIN